MTVSCKTLKKHLNKRHHRTKQQVRKDNNMDLKCKEYLPNDFKCISLSSAPSLDIPSLEVDGFYIPKDGGAYMMFSAHPKKNKTVVCPNCKSTNTVFSGYSRPRLVHDVTRNFNRVDILVKPQLCRCNECDNRFLMPVEGIIENRQMTTRLYEYLKKECFLQPHTTLASLSGFSVETIQNIMDEEIEVFEEKRRNHPIEAPRVLGIDEKHIVHTMRGTLVDVESGVLIDMLENNKAETMKNGIKCLANWDRNIKVVTTDMNNAYISWLEKLLPNATIVIDKFHVIQDIQRKINETLPILYRYRKQMIKDISDSKEKARQAAILDIVKVNKYLFKYSTERIVRDNNKAAQLATVMNEFREFAFLRNLYAIVEEMYNKATREEAEKVWEAWEQYLPPIGKNQYKNWCNAYEFEEEMFKPFQSFSQPSFKKFIPYILNYFNDGCRFTNAVTEGLNNNIERINRAGNGHTFKHLRAKALFAPMILERTVYKVNISKFREKKPTISYGFMFNGYSHSANTYTISYKYSFSSHSERIKLNPINIYESNDFIESLFAHNPDTDISIIIFNGFDNTEPMDA